MSYWLYVHLSDTQPLDCMSMCYGGEAAPLLYHSSLPLLLHSSEQHADGALTCCRP